MSVCARKLPTCTLFLSMAFRLVTSLRRKAGTIMNVQNACTSARPKGVSAKALNVRMFTVLMGWSMEDSLLMADSMKIAGWSNENRRTTYSLYRVKKRDVVALVLIVALFTLCCLFAFIDYSHFSFYPSITPLHFSLGYVDFALFALFPAILEAVNYV